MEFIGHIRRLVKGNNPWQFGQELFCYSAWQKQKKEEEKAILIEEGSGWLTETDDWKEQQYHRNITCVFDVLIWTPAYLFYLHKEDFVPQVWETFMTHVVFPTERESFVDTRICIPTDEWNILRKLVFLTSRCSLRDVIEHEEYWTPDVCPHGETADLPWEIINLKFCCNSCEQSVDFKNVSFWTIWGIKRDRDGHQFDKMTLCSDCSSVQMQPCNHCNMACGLCDANNEVFKHFPHREIYHFRPAAFEQRLLTTKPCTRELINLTLE